MRAVRTPGFVLFALSNGVEKRRASAALQNVAVQNVAVILCLMFSLAFWTTAAFRCFYRQPAGMVAQIALAFATGGR